MFTKIMQYRKLWLTVLVAAFSLLLYQELRPTIVLHTHMKLGYLGKASKINGDVEKLYVENYVSKYRMPHLWKWTEEDEIAFFSNNYNELFRREDIRFWRLDIFLDENGNYESHKVKKYFWMKP